MRYSEVFENFVKIAQDKESVSDEGKKENKSSKIQSLYNVKPNLPKDMEYENNISEDAHPDSVVLSPSYDKLNGLIENINERQNIILNILNKPPTGILGNKKYANKELVLSLVRIANDLDNKNKKSLRLLADTCLKQVCNTNNIKKKAFPIAPLVPFLVKSLAATLGVIWVQQRVDFINEGFLRNHEKLINEIDDLLESSANWGVGRKYTEDFLNEMRNFKKNLLTTFDRYKEILPIINKLEKPDTAKDLLESVKSKDNNEIIYAYNKFSEYISNFSVYLNKIESNFKDEAYKLRQIEDKGLFEKFIDYTQIFHGGKGLIADDFDDVIRAISAYKKSVFQTLDLLRKSESYSKDTERQIQEASEELKTKVKSEEKLVEKPSEKPESKDEVSDLEKDLEDLKKSFSI